MVALGHKETVATGRSGAPEFLLFTAHNLVLTCLRRIEKPRVGGSIPPQATMLSANLFSGWPFRFWGTPLHAGIAHILRVPGPR